MTDLRALARRLGGEFSGPNTILCPGPGHSPKDRSLSVTLSPTAPDGFVTFSHAGDPWAEARDHVKHVLGIARDGWKRERPPRPRPLGAAAVNGDDDDNRDVAFARWLTSRDPRGTVVETYLSSRGLDLGEDIAWRAIRWNADIGAMVALFRDIASDEPRAISRTFLDAEGRKLERRFLGPVGGSAIKLDGDEDVLGGLHIAEGLETCMAARQLDLKPCWALGSKGAIAAFPPLDGIECLTILAEPDADAAVGACARRWHGAGREVVINRAIGGKDLNDALQLRRAQP